VITTHTCYSVACATPGCDPWDDGTPHFPTAEQAIEHARSCGWTVVGDVARCEPCSRAADCDTTGHRWGFWRPRVVDGVPFRARTCDHCWANDYDPPMADLGALFNAARVVNAITSEETP